MAAILSPSARRDPAANRSVSARREARHRHYLMCRPTYFAVEYVINPWMNPETPVDRDRAISQWENLRRTYLDLGHEVSLVAPLPGLPDMVFAANGAVVVDGLVFGSRFKYAERMPEGAAYLQWFADQGFGELVAPSSTAEGEGDFLVAGEVILAGTGFRTDRSAHRELAELTGREVVTLELVDPRYYHLDTALAVLDDETVMYLPQAFSPESREILRRRYPDAILADPADAEVLGLNAVSDGRHVVLPVQAEGLARRLEERGFVPVGVDLSELLAGGGGPKCCTLEIRAGRAQRADQGTRGGLEHPGGGA